MEYRKLIKFGNSSHVMSIPNSWLKRNKLNKGDLIYFKENSNNELVLMSKLKEDVKQPQSTTIEITGKCADEIRRSINSAYINNFNTIKIIGSNLEKESFEIRKVINNLMALELIEQTNEYILARDFLNMDKVEIDNLIRKMDILIRAMLIDSRLIFKKDSVKSIEERDHDINRFTFLVYRAIKYALNNPSALELYKADYRKLLCYWQLVDHLEKFADEVKRITRHLKESNLKGKEVKELMNIYKEVENFYLNIIKAYYTNNLSLLYKTLKLKDNILKDCDNYFDSYYKKERVPNIIEKLRVMIDHARSMGRIMYN